MTALAKARAPGERNDSRAYAWFVVVVPPQKELAAERILGKEGFATFVPVRREYRYANKIARAQGRKTERRFALMPRYLFLGMGAGTPGWDRVVCYRLVQGIIGHEGRPLEVPHDTCHGQPGLRDLMWRHNAGDFNAPGYQRYMETHREFGPGDDVLAIDENLKGKVIEIIEDRARVELPFFGAYRVVEVGLANLRAAE